MLKVIDIYESQTLLRGISVYLNNQLVYGIRPLNNDWMQVITHNGVHLLESVLVRSDKKLKLGKLAFKNDERLS